MIFLCTNVWNLFQVGSDIYVCYKKSMHRSNYIAYMAGILDHYPSNHYPGFPIPTDLALFCLPMGATLESWPAKSAQPQPIFSTFVLTVTAGGGNTEAVEKVYGAAVSFYEKYPHELLTDEQREALKLNEHFGRNNIVHTNKCICILSRWPFFDTFDKFLRYLHTMANTGPHHVPIERWERKRKVSNWFVNMIQFKKQIELYNNIGLFITIASPKLLIGSRHKSCTLHLQCAEASFTY